MDNRVGNVLLFNIQYTHGQNTFQPIRLSELTTVHCTHTSSIISIIIRSRKRDVKNPSSTMEDDDGTPLKHQYLAPYSFLLDILITSASHITCRQIDTQYTQVQSCHQIYEPSMDLKSLVTITANQGLTSQEHFMLYATESNRKSQIARRAKLALLDSCNKKT